MAKLTAAERNALSDADFAYIDSSGDRHLPLHDANHVRDAMSRWKDEPFESPAKKASARRKILAAAKKFGIDVSKFSNPLKSVFDNLMDGLSGGKAAMGVVQIESDFSTVVQYDSTLI